MIWNFHIIRIILIYNYLDITSLIAILREKREYQRKYPALIGIITPLPGGAEINIIITITTIICLNQ